LSGLYPGQLIDPIHVNTGEIALINSTFFAIGKPGQFEASAKYLHWSYFALAVLDVYEENERKHREGHTAIKHNADDWMLVDDLRAILFNEVKAAWCHLADEPPGRFPWSVDGVTRLYMRFRKRSTEEVIAFRREIVEALPR
jgi:hypothetical protein